MSEASPAVTGKKRGRPPRKKETEKEAAESIVQLNNDNFSSCPQSPDIMSADAPPPPSPFDEAEWLALKRVIETAFCMASPVLDKKREEKLIKLIQSEIRKDPRSEELKELKQQVGALSHVTKEEKEMEKKVIEEAANLKRTCDEATKQIEPALKKIATQDQHIKALLARLGASEERIKSLEGMVMK